MNLESKGLNQSSENVPRKKKSLIPKIAIAIIVLLMIGPYALIFMFALALSIGMSAFLIIAIISIFLYTVVTAFLIFIYSKIKGGLGKTIFFGILILILLFIASGPFPDNSNSYRDASVSDCEKIKDDEIDLLGNKKKDLCYLKATHNKADKNNCEKIESIDIKEKCYWSVALDEENPDHCLQIKDFETRYKCMGRSSVNSSYCDTVVSDVSNTDPQKEYCYIGLAVKLVRSETGGISECKMISDPKLRKICCNDVSWQGSDEEKKEKCLREIL